MHLQHRGAARVFPAGAGQLGPVELQHVLPDALELRIPGVSPGAGARFTRGKTYKVQVSVVYLRDCGSEGGAHGSIPLLDDLINRCILFDVYCSTCLQYA